MIKHLILNSEDILKYKQQLPTLKLIKDLERI